MPRITYCVLFLVALSSSIYGLDEESAKGDKCFEIKKTVPLDVNWLQSVKTLYYSVMSRLELYRATVQFTRGDFKNITEDKVYYDGCIKFVFTSDGAFEATGFNGLRAKWPVKPEDPAMEKYQFGEEGGWAGTCYTTLTDNKSYFFCACCSNGDEMHWGVLSPLKTLPEETVKIIHEHAESLGFSKEQFTSLRYDFCDRTEEKE